LSTDFLGVAGDATLKGGIDTTASAIGYDYVAELRSKKITVGQQPTKPTHVVTKGYVDKALREKIAEYASGYALCNSSGGVDTANGAAVAGSKKGTLNVHQHDEEFDIPCSYGPGSY